MNPKQKPVRVATAEVVVFTCPVCRTLVYGTVEVAVHLGDVSMTNVIESDGDTVTLEANATASTEMRSLDVRHKCNLPTDAEAAPEPVLPDPGRGVES